MPVLRMLGTMRHKGILGKQRPRFSRARTLLAWLPLCLPMAHSEAQSCTTQARMTAAQRTSLGQAAYSLASAVQAGDSARVRTLTVSQYAGDAAGTDYLVRVTSQHIAKGTLQVTHLYLLDASARKPADTSEADFACALAGSVSETDFGIAGLPPGTFAFAMVEVQGAQPWLLAFLLQQEAGSWKMAGFYPHTRAAAGHDGLWYWNAARTEAKANKPWLAWLMFSTADQLLRPAGFVATGNLDKLRNEQRAAAPQPLGNGISPETPLSVQGNGAVFQVTQLTTRPTDDARGLILVLHFQGTAPVPGQDATVRNVQAAHALLSAHPELRDPVFGEMEVIADVPGANPVVVQRPLAELAASR